MFEIIGIIAITLVLGYLALGCLMFALMTFGGLDEYNPLAGTVFTIVLVGICALWWFLVGTHIDISLNYSG